ncbi:MAG: hypothetical protein IKR32_05015 [Bacteroidales bacterium]|nr:hypothetical protein [Bacteroidales bacterium]
MDIDLLSKMVREIILESDEVTLPGVGMFVAETVPATFSNKGFTINPPYRRLSFRQKQGSDTLLADYYAATYAVPRDKAAEVLEAFLSGMKDVLKERKTIVFPGLGRLRATKENQFFFVSDEAMDICPQAFGLEAVSLKSHGTVEAPAVPAVPDPVGAEEGDFSTALEMTEKAAPEMTEKAAERDFSTPLEMTEKAALEMTGKAALEMTGKAAAEMTERGSWWKAVLWTVAVAAVLLGLLAVLGRVAPDFVDRFLYTKEELEVLRYVL